MANLLPIANAAPAVNGSSQFTSVYPAMSIWKPAKVAGRHKTSQAAGMAHDEQRQAQSFSATKRRTLSRDIPARKGRNVLTTTTDAEAKALLTKYKTRLQKMAKNTDKCYASIDNDDLLQAGWIGLIEASHDYDEHFSVAFWPYAYHRAQGAMLDAVRSARYVPRSVQREWTIQSYIDDLHGAGVEDRPVGMEHSKAWAELSESLPSRERQIVALFLIRGFTLQDVGELYDISESRVSQIVKRALRRLRSSA
jgi:RNA polymerase sigma factor (sigma-70 family)